MTTTPTTHADTLTPKQLAELRNALEMSRSENTATGITGVQTLEHLVHLYAPALIAAAEENATRRENRDALTPTWRTGNVIQVEGLPSGQPPA